MMPTEIIVNVIISVRIIECKITTIYPNTVKYVVGISQKR